MNILILTEEVSKTGVGSYIYQLCDYLSNSVCVKEGKVIVLSPKVEVSLPHGVVFVQLPYHEYNMMGIVADVRCLYRVVKEYNIDIIHIQQRRMSFLVKIHNLFDKTPSVLTIHNVYMPKSFIKRLLMSNRSYTIAVSSEVFDFCASVLKLNKKKMHVICNGVNEKELFPLSNGEKTLLFQKFDLDSSKTTICMHGRIDPIKQIDLLVDAVNMMDKKDQERIQCLISGEKNNNQYYEEIKSKINEYGLNSIFHFVGWEKARNILGCSDLMVLPSKSEGFSLSVIEAFFMNVPVIRSRTGGYSHMKNVCIGLKENDAATLCSEIKKFLDFGPYTEMVHDAHALAVKEFSIEAMANKTFALYEEIINENKKS